MPLAVYSAVRLALLGAVVLLLALAGLRGWLLLGVAVVIAWLASYALLGRLRDGAARYLAEAAERRRSGEGPRFGPRIEADAAYEDALVADRDGARPFSRDGDRPISDREAEPEQDPEGQLEQPRRTQHHDQQPAPGPRPDGQ